MVEAFLNLGECDLEARGELEELVAAEPTPRTVAAADVDELLGEQQHLDQGRAVDRR